MWADRLSFACSLCVSLELLCSHVSTVCYPLLPLSYLLLHLLPRLHCRPCLLRLLLSSHPAVLLAALSYIPAIISVQLFPIAIVVVDLHLLPLLPVIRAVNDHSLVHPLSLLVLLLLLAAAVVDCVVLVAVVLLCRLCGVALSSQQSLVRLVLFGLRVELLLFGCRRVVALPLVNDVLQ